MKIRIQLGIDSVLREKDAWLTSRAIGDAFYEAFGVRYASNRISAALTNGMQDPNQPKGLVAKGVVLERIVDGVREYRAVADGQAVIDLYGGEEAMALIMRTMQIRRERISASRTLGKTLKQCEHETHAKAYQLADRRCVLCGIPIPSLFHACRAHDVPASAEAVCGWDNLGMAHYACNLHAGTLTFEEVWALPDGDPRVPPTRDIPAAKAAVAAIRRFLS